MQHVTKFNIGNLNGQYRHVIEEQVTQYCTAKDNSCDPPTAVIKHFLLIRIGGILFESETYIVQYSEYQEKGKQALLDLQNLLFSPEDTEGFWQRNRFEVKRMVEWQHPLYGARKKDCGFLACLIKNIELMSLVDEWLAPYRSLVCCICVNNLQLPRLPWEVAIWGTEGKIDGVPETIKIPEEIEVFQKALQMRRQVLTYFDPSTTYTVVDMQKIVCG